MSEIWKDSPIYPDRYEVSNKGRIRSKSYLIKRNNAYKEIEYWTKPKLLKPVKRKDGYLRITLSKDTVEKKFYLHRLIAMVFCEGFKEGLEVNHKDFNRSNNNFSNLEWVTPSENQKHVYREKRRCVKNINHPRASFTIADIKSIRKLYKNGESAIKISRKYDRSLSTIKDIVSNRTWKGI